MNAASIRTRLTLGSIGVQALVLVTLGGCLWAILRINLMAILDRDLARKKVEVMQRWGKAKAGERDAKHTRRDDNRVSVRTGAEAADASEHHLSPRFFTLQEAPFFPDVAEPPWETTGLHLAIVGQSAITEIRSQGEPLRVLSFPLIQEGKQVGVGQIVLSLRDAHQQLGMLAQAYLLLLPLALLITGASGAFQTGRMLLPLRHLARATERIEASDLADRLPVHGRDEFAHLTRTINGMLERLQRAFQQQQQFTADASHELKTPLTAIVLHTSAVMGEDAHTLEAYRRAIEGANQASLVMTHIVHDLLLLARLDAGSATDHLYPIAIQDVLHTAMEMTSDNARAPIHLVMDEAPHLVEGDAIQLVRLFTNLLDNALRHTTDAGAITVSLLVSGTEVVVMITDTGEGIAPEHLAHLGERFYRVDSARGRQQGGTGLGLAISKGIVEAHRGKFIIESTLGLGTKVTVMLPIASTKKA